jgi:hypothetical protein
MRRLIFTLTIVAGLFVPGVAIASRVATGSTRNAIDRAAAAQVPPGSPERCLFAQVTTKDGGNWAEVGFNGPQYRTCERWVFNGVVVLRRTRGRWDYVTSGSAMLPCGRIGIPVAVRQDLHLPCAVTLPTGPLGARHLTEFLSPDRKIWCLSGGGIPAIPFSCAANPRTFPKLSADLSNQGKVTICLVTHLIQQPGHPPDTCFENFNDQASVLQVGQQNYVDGVLCKSATNGITCSLTAGTGRGKGFFINTNTVSRVGP